MKDKYLSQFPIFVASGFETFIKRFCYVLFGATPRGAENFSGFWAKSAPWQSWGTFHMQGGSMKLENAFTLSVP